MTAGSGYQGCLSFANPGGAQTNHPDGWCFDASGNLLAKSGTCPPAAPNFVYDGENRMVADPTAGATYVYDGNGTRVQKCLPNCTSPTSSTVFIFSGSQDIAEYDNGAAPGSPSREFIYSDAIPGSGLLASISSGSITYFQSDHLDWRVSTNSSGQGTGSQGHYPFGESWYSNNGNDLVFTSYQRDSESGLDYAMARYYDSTAARFCSADPLGGQLDDPQTWNRYTYVRNDPVNLTDPSGKGFFTWLIDALAILADIFSGGAATPETVQLGVDLQAMDAVATMAAVVHTGMATEPQGKTVPPPPLPFPLPKPPGAETPGAPDYYTKCPPVLFTIKAPGPGQATSPTGAAGVPKMAGTVAYNPSDFGLNNAQAKALDRSTNAIFFKPDWSSGQIPGPHGVGTVPPAPNAGMPTVPNGLPVSQDSVLLGTDTLGQRSRNPANTIDMYGYKTAQDAAHATRRVPTVAYVPKGAKCPRSR